MQAFLSVGLSFQLEKNRAVKLSLDSSALAKRYVLEPGTDQVLKYCTKATQIFLSTLCALELISALNRLIREKKLTQDTYLDIKRTMIQDFQQATLIEPHPELIEEAVFCLENTVIRSLDAIHLATAKIINCDLFVTSDKKQYQAAKKLKIPAKLI